VKIGLFTNINGIGLQKDAELLQRFLVSEGHVAELVQYDEPCEEEFELGISIETFNVDHVPHAKRWWYIANPEWLKPESVRPIQRHCEKVLAKTRDAERRLRLLFANTVYAGFFAEDHYDAGVKREDRVLHLGGNSGMRGTNELLACYREYRYYDKSSLPPLTCITNSKMVDTTPVEGVEFRSRVSDEELLKLQNSHRFHAMPSNYEGWGQALHEAQSVGAVLLTTGAGPMSELSAPFEANARSGKTYNLGELYEVDICDLRRKLPEMVKQPNYEVARMGMEARARFVRGNRDAGIAFKRLLEPQERRSVAGVGGEREKPRIALLGNFRPEHSTENDLLWTLRDMGYPTIPFQEDEDRTEEILEGCRDVALLIYVHTHSWATPGKLSLDELWKELKNGGTRTASFHLDRYWGLNELDRREDRIGTHPFWRTECVFTADGGNEERFEARSVEHHWLAPGVVKRDCYVGEWRKDLAVDVGFVGAEGYHPEYIFRGQLLNFLRQVYGERFRLFQGYRGQSLNDVYASCRVVVGDSCFGGADFYWSDRVPETLGRFGFLVHPYCKGLTIPGMVTFTPGDLYELQDRIDYFLANEDARQASVRLTSKWVKDHETYHARMKSLLTKMGTN
jgi:hypothetical protein